MLLTRYFFLDEFSAFEEFFKKYPHENCQFKKNEYLCESNQSFKKVYYIQSGLTRVSVLYDNGEEKVIGFWGNGGLYPLICTEQNFILEYSIMLKALTDVSAFAFTVDTIREMMAHNSELCYEMINHYCKFGNLLFFCAATQTYDNVYTRICNILYIYLKNMTNSKKTVNLNQSDIASIIGATRIAVVKALKQLREEKIIKTTRNSIIVLDLNKLEEKCTELLK